MILVTGGTGNLGVELTSRLAGGGSRVRVLTRDRERAQQRLGSAAEIFEGDVQNPGSLEAAVNGVDAVASAMTGFGPGGRGPRAVDYEGNLKLIHAAEAAGARRFVLVSMHGAAGNHPMELLRMKDRAEKVLQASQLDWTIVRPTVFMELWTGIVGDPIVKTGKTTVFGRGENPINFVSARDVAGLVELALLQHRLARQVLEIGGPQNLTFNDLVRQIELATGRRARVRHVPVPVMRLSALVMRPFKSDIAGMIQAGITLDTIDMTFDVVDLRRRFPELGVTYLADVLHSQFSRTPNGSDAALQTATKDGTPQGGDSTGGPTLKRRHVRS